MYGITSRGDDMHYVIYHQGPKVNGVASEKSGAIRL